VFLALALIAAVMLLKRGFTRTTIAILSVLVLGYPFYDYWYNRKFRPYFENEIIMQISRSDIGRDGDIKLAIYTELHGNEPGILEYRGQTALFAVTMFVPRVWWPEKPYPYYRYLTAKATGTPSGTSSFNLTTSVLGESVANFGFAGMLIPPLLLGLACRWGDSCRDKAMTIYTGLSVSFLLFTEASAAAVFLAPWVGLVLLCRRRNGSSIRSQVCADATCRRRFSETVVRPRAMSRSAVV
jgi:hypothetical protein